MLIVSGLSYKINNLVSIFENISFTIGDNEKVAIVGKNGIGKSVLLQLIVGKIKADSGKIIKNNLNFSYFPQKFNELNFSSIADVFGLEKQVISLANVENNCADVVDYENLDGNWDCMDKIKEKMKFFGLNFDLMRDFSTLSGGEKVELILSSIIDKNSNFLILDEPTNNMDYGSKKYFYDFVKNWQGGLIVVSHDRELLNLVDRTLELRRVGMRDTKLFCYGGNYEYWRQQKELENQALEKDYNNSIKSAENRKNQTIKNIKNIAEKKKQGEKALNNCKNSPTAFGLKKSQAEKSEGKVANKLNKRLNETNNDIQNIKEKIEVKSNIYFKFPKNGFRNKTLVEINNLNFFYGRKQIFNDFELLVRSGDRIAINGKNGSGKSTLLNIIMGKIKDFRGDVRINADNIVYLDQNCDFLKGDETILKNVMMFSSFRHCWEHKNTTKQSLTKSRHCEKQSDEARSRTDGSLLTIGSLSVGKVPTERSEGEAVSNSYPLYEIASPTAHNDGSYDRDEDNWQGCHTINEKQARDILAMFLFRTDDVFKKVADLSGGEKLRVALACVFSGGDMPELILLDEPTNNMDLDSIEVLENILKQYNGGLVVVSHDRVFKENINIDKIIEL